MKRIIALILALLLCLALAACGDQDTGSAASESGQSASTPDESKPSDASSEADSGTSSKAASGSNNKTGSVTFNSVDEYLAFPEVKEKLDAAVKSVESMSDVLTFKYYAQDNQLHYDYTYKEQYEGAILETLKETLEQDLETNPAYPAIVDEMKGYIKIDDPQFVISYLNADGTVIATKTYE